MISHWKYLTDDISLGISQWRYLTGDISLGISGGVWRRYIDIFHFHPLKLSAQEEPKVFEPSCSCRRRRRSCEEPLWHPTPLASLQLQLHHCTIVSTVTIHNTKYRVSYTVLHCSVNTVICKYCKTVQGFWEARRQVKIIACLFFIFVNSLFATEG